MNNDLEMKNSIVEMLKNKKLIEEKSGEDIKFIVEDIYLGEIREFSSEERGGISLDIYSYLFLVRCKEGLLNPFCLTDTVNYAVYRPSREEYDKYIYVQGEEKDGPCIVISPFTEKVRHQLDGEDISLSDLENYILRVKGFFKDREDIVNENFLNPITKHKLLKDDEEKKENYCKFIEESTLQLGK